MAYVHKFYYGSAEAEKWGELVDKPLEQVKLLTEQTHRATMTMMR